ncbi:MAG TPA: hypothetical protein VMY06_00495 [Sedimentisphaerales bacterium]|nr:hypothetical protein [Sedimentisphaerales bacterium]
MSDYEILTITISIFAIATSFLALGWNIYRDVILKPRLKVRLQISIIMQGEYKSPSKISIRATNFGPNKIRCTSIDANSATLWRRIFRKVKYAQIIDDYTDPYSSKLPCELDVGATCQLFLPFVKDCLLGEPFTHIGIMDSFGRTHWAPKKDIAKARKRYEEEFAQK